MSKFKSKLIIAVIIMFGIIAFISCEKENNGNADVNNELFNNDNPYDIYGKDIKVFYSELELIIKDKKNEDKKEFDKELSIIIDKYKNIYPIIDTSNYSDNESAYICELIILHNKTNDIKRASQEVEQKLNMDNNLNTNQKNRLLLLISQYKYNIFYSSKALGIDYCKDWDGDFDNCMRRELSSIFADDGNPVPETSFIAGIPGSLFWLEGECIYEATFL